MLRFVRSAWLSPSSPLAAFLRSTRFCPFFFAPLLLLISLCFTARKSKSPRDSVSEAHFAPNVSCLRPAAADFFETKPAVNECGTTSRISLNAERTTASTGIKKGPCSEKVLGLIPGISVRRLRVCVCFCLRGFSPTVQLVWLETGGVSPRIRWAGMRRG